MSEPTRWPLTDVQTGFLKDAVQTVQQAQNTVQFRTRMILKELAESRGLNPEHCSGKLVETGEGKLAFEIASGDTPTKPTKSKP